MKKHYITLLLLGIMLVLPATSAQAANVYKVEPGDTLWTIAQKSGVSVGIISQQNDISNPGQLYVGQPLVIKISVDYGGNQVKEEYTSYTVQSGDSLWLIAVEHNMTVKELAAVNNLTNYNLTVGQTLFIPGNQTKSDSKPESNYSYYTVKRGDILWTIAQEYNTTVEELVELNDIKTAYDLYVGRQLLVPNTNSQTEEKDSIYYTVQPGDILWNIAQKQGTTVQKLVELNGIKSAYDLYVGRKLLVVDPNGQVDFDQQPEEAELYYIYQLKEEESLREVSNKFGLDIYTLIRENEITDETELIPGTELIIPLQQAAKLNYEQWAAAKLNNYYQVRNQQTLAEIAAWFNLSEAGLRKINDFEADEEVSVGQRLLMPVNTVLFDRHQLDTVKGDKYLFDIAVEQGITVKSLLRANYLSNPNRQLSRGTTVLIPLTDADKTDWIRYKNGKSVNPWFG